MMFATVSTRLMKILPVGKQLTSFRLRDFYSIKLVFNRFYAENQSPGLLACVITDRCVCTFEYMSKRTHKFKSIRLAKRILFILVSFDVLNLNTPTRYVYVVFFSLVRKQRSMPFIRNVFVLATKIIHQTSVWMPNWSNESKQNVCVCVVFVSIQNWHRAFFQRLLLNLNTRPHRNIAVLNSIEQLHSIFILY